MSGRIHTKTYGDKFGLIKAVSDTVLDMVVTTYHDKPLIYLVGQRFVRDPSPIIGRKFSQS